MSSWSGTAYPTPRARSRSRSPYRGPSYPPRPGYGDPLYSGEPFRGEWDAYDRDRAWANYDRDRAGYDYGRRGRSRSPPTEEVGRKRRRSPSPWDRERYEPRPRYGDDYDHGRGHGHPSPPHRGPYPPPSYGSGRRAPPDPHTLDYPASLKQYAEWFRYFYPQDAADEDSKDKAAELEAGDGTKPRNGIRSRWEKYRKDYAAQQLQRMFEHHRKSPWFAEKYDPSPEFVKLRSRVRRVGWRGRIDSFLLDLEAGKFDPDLNEPDIEPEPISPVKEANGEASSNGVDTTSLTTPVMEEPKASLANADDEMQFNVEPDDDTGDQDANRDALNGKSSTDRRKQGGEEISIDPEGNQVMIRTIPPDIGRVKLEEACGKIPGLTYLALGDPLQKRNYYRAGWLRFRDDADMVTVMGELAEKKIEGFKLHVAHITKPFTNKIRVAPEVASRPERLEKDLQNARALASLLEEEYSKILRDRAEVKAESATATENPPVDGADVKMEEPVDELDDEDREPREPGSIAVERRIEKVVAEMRDQGLFDGCDEKEEETKRVTIALDLYLAYLRTAFNTCYYCAVTTDHMEELQRKCIKHVRKPITKASDLDAKPVEFSKTEQEAKPEEDAKPDVKEEKDKEKDVSSRDKDKATDGKDPKRNDERWLEWLDQKVALLINRDGVDPRDYGGKSYDDELSKATEQYIKQEDEGKFRCKTCQKLFKATSFVEKHIANKHGELVKHLDELPYFNNFALDPHRIQPFTHPPPPVGNNQPPPQAYGLQGPAFVPPMEFGRLPPHPGYGGPYPPPPYLNGGFWDPYTHPYMPGSYPPPRRDESVTARRLSDRISGFAPGTDLQLETPIVPASAGLPAKPMVAPDVIPTANGGRRNGRNSNAQNGPPPPPPDAKEDPRAAAGRKVSYHDMDLVAEGDIELTY